MLFQWRQSPDSSHILDDMVKEVKSFNADKLIGVTRAFSHFLALANSAENHHRVRRLRERLLDSGLDSALPMKVDSFAGTVYRLKDELGISAEDIHRAISTQYLEIVLTAHPTEVNRRTTIQKHQRIFNIIDQLDRCDLTPYERRQHMKDLNAQISSIWDSDELRRAKPGPVKEAQSGLAVVENVLWNAVPKYLRKVDDILKQQIGKPLPLGCSPIKVASWMGGDRDGNPNVTAEITFEVSMMSRWLAATLFKADIIKLRSELSILPASKELKEATGNSREPYRFLLRQLEAKLEATIEWTDNLIKNPKHISNLKPMLKNSELMDALMILHRSLIETKHEDLADGMLTDVIRKVAAFGLSLLPMDIRQESTRHSEALDAITRYLGVGSYLQWDEATRRNWLQLELTSKRPLLPRLDDGGESLGFSPTVVDTLKTFNMIARMEEGSLGAYVISQCQQASDILAVALLQQDAGGNPPLRVVPLFETLDDLERSAATVDALFSISTYRGRIANKQEIMVGYSDSAKDAGRLAAAWALYNAQEAMVQIGKKHGVELTFFHGKGGTVGRGGNPALYEAILAHPPRTINGRFRITEQGEMITQNFGQDAIAERTLDLFTSGILMEGFLKRPEPKKEWRDMMLSLSDISCAAYRKIVRQEPRFVPYFRTATPELELAGLNVGSRPAKRNPKGGVER
jgi:phosphoenolpyruvate carboxylase